MSSSSFGREGGGGSAQQQSAVGGRGGKGGAGVPGGVLPDLGPLGNYLLSQWKEEATRQAAAVARRSAAL